MKMWQYQLIESELQKRFGAANVELELFSDYMVIHVRHQMCESRHYYPLDGLSTVDIINDVSSCYLMVKGGRKND